MKVYDCFAFFNELDLLEIRLEELYEVVDVFVLVEATKTFQGGPKPLYFRENSQRFAKWADKIRVITVDHYPSFWAKFRKPRPFDLDDHQKEQIRQGLHDAKPDDVVIVSDLDEIPMADKVRAYCQKPGIKVFEQRLYYYFLDLECNHFDLGGGSWKFQYNRAGRGYWRGTVMLSFKDLKTIQKARMERGFERANTVVIEDGGWHFSYLGGIEKIIEKLQSYAHNEHNTSDYTRGEYVRQAVQTGKSLFDPKTTFVKVSYPMDGFLWPRAVQENPQRFSHLMSPKEG